MDVYFYIAILDSITRSIILSNFLVNILDLKYSKILSALGIFIINSFADICNANVINYLGLNFLNSLQVKFIINYIVLTLFLYKISSNTLKQTILRYMYFILMAGVTEIIAFIVFDYKSSDLTIFIHTPAKMVFSIMANAIASLVSMFFLLLYFKIKNKIKQNYMFLILILAVSQVFILNKYIAFFRRNMTSTIVLIGVVFFIIQIIVNIIVLNLVIKSILSYDLEQKIYRANLENEKNKYVRGLYKNQKSYFNRLISNFKSSIESILNSTYLIKKNGFSEEDIFDKELENIISQSENLNETIVDILEKYKTKSH